MMRRRVAVGRRGPGLLGTMARTAVVAGTATAVAKGVSGSMDQKAAQQQAAAQQQQQQQQQMLAAQAAPPPVASPGSTTDTTIRQLQQLAELQNQGILTPEEFAQQKAMILGGGGAS